MNKIVISIIIILALAGFVIFRGGEKSSELKNTDSKEQKIGTRIGNLAPDFELIDYDGNKIKLSDFRGKNPVFLNFWASWCYFCVDEMALMAKVQKEFSGQYVTLAINRGEDQETGQKFTDSLGVSNDFILLNDRSDSAYSLYQGFAMPYSIFIDKEGVIKELKLGPLTKEELKAKLEKIL